MKESGKGICESEEPSLHRKIQAEGWGVKEMETSSRQGSQSRNRQKNQQEGHSKKSRRKDIGQDMGATLKTSIITEWVGSHWNIKTVPRILH